MSFNNSNCITKKLSITDANITFSDKISHKVVAGKNSLIFDAILAYDSKICPCCGNLDLTTIIKHGSKNTMIRILPINGEPTTIRLKKQRFLCKKCCHTFVANTDLVENHCSISNRLRTHILTFLADKISEQDIAKHNNVSHSTVSRYIDRDFKKYSPSKFKLPKNLSFDEFKSTKNAKGSMSFIVTDLDKRESLDIVENRQLRYLMQYFRSFTKKARHSVKSITIDMYKPYIILIKALFPNAKIIFDRFHIINNLSRALVKTRIDAMKKLSKYSIEYKRLKKYWKLIQMDYDDLDAISFKHFTHLKGLKTEFSVVRQSIEVDDLLHETYENYQALLKSIKKKDSLRLKTLLESLKDKWSRYIQTAIKTMLNNFEYVSNALKSSFSMVLQKG